MKDSFRILKYSRQRINPGQQGSIPHDFTNISLRDVLDERIRQEEKWGEQNHDPFTYLAILQEEVGEFSKEAVEERFNGELSPNLREECVQMAAVALAMVECLDRDLWSWPSVGKEDS